MNDPNEDQEKSLSLKSTPKLSLNLEEKLTKEECEKLKTLCPLLAEKNQKLNTPIEHPLGWIKANELEELKILCDLEAEDKKKTIKNYQSTNKPAKNTKENINHL